MRLILVIWSADGSNRRTDRTIRRMLMKSTCSGWSAGGRKRLPLPLLHHQEARSTEVPKIKLSRLRGLAVTLSLLVAVAGQQLCLGQAVDPTPTSPAAIGESQNLSAWFQYIALEL